MDQRVNKDVCVIEELRNIFGNPEIYGTFKIEERYPSNPVYINKNEHYWTIDLVVKQRQHDFMIKRETWNEELFIEYVNKHGRFQSKRQSFSGQNLGIITNYLVHISDMDGFKQDLVKLSEDIYNREFTKQLESKLSED